MLKVLCFGNPHFGQDRVALDVGKMLSGSVPGTEFVFCGMDESCLDSAEDGTVVLDVARGISEVRFLKTEELAQSRSVTAHDIDVGFYIRMLEKEGKRLVLLGIPEGMVAEKAAGEVRRALNHLRTSRK